MPLPLLPKCEYDDDDRGRRAEAAEEAEAAVFVLAVPADRGVVVRNRGGILDGVGVAAAAVAEKDEDSGVLASLLRAAGVPAAGAEGVGVRVEAANMAEARGIIVGVVVAVAAAAAAAVVVVDALEAGFPAGVGVEGSAFTALRKRKDDDVDDVDGDGDGGEGDGSVGGATATGGDAASLLVRALVSFPLLPAGAV